VTGAALDDHRSGASTPSTSEPAVARARLAIVEDHALLAQSLAFALMNLGVDVMVVADLSPAAVVETLRTNEPDMVLLDFDLGDAGVGLDLIPAITELGLRVVMLTGEKSPVTLAECVEAGAIGIIDKSEPFARLIEQVRDVADGRGILSRPARDSLLAELRAHRTQESHRLSPFQRLTVRESEVLQDLVEGKNAERIAEESYVSVATVRSHIKAVLAKLGVNSQLAAVAMVRRAGWSTADRRRTADD
jgi:DNA-binding NarL/FixJ family response regulator